MIISWSINDRRNNKLKLELLHNSLETRFITPFVSGKKNVYLFTYEGKSIETFKFYFNVQDLLKLKKFLGETIRELRIRYKKKINTLPIITHLDKLIVERAGHTTFTKVYFMGKYRTTTFFCDLKHLVKFRREVSDTIIDIMLTKKLTKK